MSGRFQEVSSIGRPIMPRETPWVSRTVTGLIEWDMIVVTIFLSILNQMDFEFEPIGFPLGSNRKENCRHDHIPFKVKGDGNIIFPSATGKTTAIRRAAVREADRTIRSRTIRSHFYIKLPPRRLG